MVHNQDMIDYSTDQTKFNTLVCDDNQGCYMLGHGVSKAVAQAVIGRSYGSAGGSVAGFVAVGLMLVALIGVGLYIALKKPSGSRRTTLV